MISRDLEAQIDAPEAPVSSCRKTCSNWFDANYFKSVIRVNDIFCPMSWKKPLWWGATTAALGGVIAIEVTTGAFSAAATYNNIGIMAALYAVDPLVQTVNIFAAKYQPALAAEVNADAEPADEVLSDENHSAQYSPYGSEVDEEPSPEIPPKDKEELDSPYGSEQETVYDYMVDEEPAKAETALEREIKANHLKNKDIAVVIPTHLAADKIAATLRSLLIHVKPHQIFIIDNGHSNEPMDNTRETVAGISSEINYVWGHKGNKTYAQLIGTFLANNFKYIYTSDDDMRVPRYFSFGAERMNDKVKAVAYPILGVHPEPGQTNWWIRAQSLEYTLADCSKLAQDRFGDVLYPHGAASLWERETFLRVLYKHTAVFYAEDVQFGMILQQIGYAMTMEAGACLDTETPTSLFGPTPNLAEQRGRSWEMGRQWNYFKFLYQLFCVLPPTKSPINFVAHKFAEAYAVYTNTVDWMRLPLFLLMLRNPDYWIRLAIITGAGYIPILGWNYIKLPMNNRKDLQSSVLDILTFPVFKLVESALSIYGIGRLLSVYGPNYTHKPTVKEFEDSFRGDPAKLEKEIYTDSLNANIPPVTYKTIMYGRLFKPAQTNEEIGREFDENMYHVYQDAIIEAMEQGLPAAEVFDAAVTPGTASPRSNPVYQENYLQHDNPLFNDESPIAGNKSTHTETAIDVLAREFDENCFYVYPTVTVRAPEQEANAAIELATLTPRNNVMYQNNTLQQDNPLFDSDSVPEPKAMKM